MAERTILQLGNPLLWRKSEPEVRFGTEELKSLIQDLDDSLAAFVRTNGFGRGIAAVQVGVSKQVIFIRITPSGFVGAMVNPKIIRRSAESVEVWDGCFSFPQLMVRVTRSCQVRVEYQDESGDSHTIDAEGEFAELLQHEIDHLEGILATDRASSPRSLMTRQAWLLGRR